MMLTKHYYDVFLFLLYSVLDQRTRRTAARQARVLMNAGRRFTRGTAR